MKKSKLGKNRRALTMVDRFLNKPLYVEKSYAQTALSFFGGREGFDFIVTQDERIPINQSIFANWFEEKVARGEIRGPVDTSTPDDFDSDAE